MKLFFSQPKFMFAGVVLKAGIISGWHYNETQPWACSHLMTQFWLHRCLQYKITTHEFYVFLLFNVKIKSDFPHTA